MWKKLRYILFAALMYGGFLLATFPAAQAYALFKQRLAPDARLVLEGVSGTVWSGRAQAALIGSQRLFALTWELRPWALLIGRLRVDWGFRDGDNFARGSVARGLGGTIYINDLDARLDVTKIAPLKDFLPLDLEGFIGVHVLEFEMKNFLVKAAEGTLAWHDAAITYMQKVTLGDLRVTVEPSAEGIKAILADGGGPLQAEGVLLLKPDGNYQFTGAFASRDATQRVLAQSLRFLGRPGADGKVKVTQSGSLADFAGWFSGSSSQSK